MAEKVITLEDISLLDFFGVANRNMEEISDAFPKTKIISRGNQIKLIGTEKEVTNVFNIINNLIAHYNKYGTLSEEHVKSIINKKKVIIPVEDISSTNEDIILYGNKGLIIRAKTQNQKKLVQAALKNDLVFVSGPAGTGKTYISVAIAVRSLKNREVKKIVITRPAVEAGEHLGFLPGDYKEKVDPYLRPIYDALEDMIPVEKLKLFYETGVIEIAPLAYMRGRTLHNAFILLDEAQNTTPMQMKMFLTRMGASSKMIVTGDKSQIDLPGKQPSGLVHALDTLKNIDGIGFAELDSTDVLRHKLVEKIINAYSKNEEKK
ncbi:MAG: PhoH family protein [Cytophagaceae bacterium]|nr:PhoH family protein [Cytophagaceae bacterium]MDW8456571.1 PhoH family protein [Cytophagaceae bacterium]